MARPPREKTIPVQTRIPESHVAKLDEVAAGLEFPVTRSAMVAQIVKEWVEQRLANCAKPKGKK